MPKIQKENTFIKDGNKMNTSKLSTKGRLITKPKKFITTSSDEQHTMKQKIIKHKNVNISEELQDLRSSGVQPNILKDISSNNINKSLLEHATSETPQKQNKRHAQIEPSTSGLRTNIPCNNEHSRINVNNVSKVNEIDQSISAATFIDNDIRNTKNNTVTDVILNME